MNDTQNDVLNELGFILSLVLQHSEVIFGNGWCGRLLGCVRDVKAVNTKKVVSHLNIVCVQTTALPFCDV